MKQTYLFTFIFNFNDKKEKFALILKDIEPISKEILNSFNVLCEDLSYSYGRHMCAQERNIFNKEDNLVIISYEIKESQKNLILNKWENFFKNKLKPKIISKYYDFSEIVYNPKKYREMIEVLIEKDLINDNLKNSIEENVKNNNKEVFKL